MNRFQEKNEYAIPIKDVLNLKFNYPFKPKTLENLIYYKSFYYPLILAFFTILKNFSESLERLYFNLKTKIGSKISWLVHI